MKEFLPWSTKVYKEAMRKYISGQFSILDIQLSGQCNYNCIYCDSPNRNLSSRINWSHLESLILQEKDSYNWMFICGLGEPLWNENKTVLLSLLELCKATNIRCTIFTNGSNIDSTILEYVRDGVLFPLIKIDTFSSSLAKSLYGTSQATKNLYAIENLFEIAKNINSEYYPVAASIVPTRKNMSEIPYIVKRCIENNAFPLLGQLEYAGKAIGNYDDLLLTKDELLELKSQISEVIGCEYKVPICPSVVAGIHINNAGCISVDSTSGLSCSWFWLETPQIINLCEIEHLSSLKEAEDIILSYRNKTLFSLKCISSKIEEHPFGGCGGNIKDLFNDYLNIQKRLISNS